MCDGDVNIVEPDEPFLLSGVHLDMPVWTFCTNGR